MKKKFFTKTEVKKEQTKSIEKPIELYITTDPLIAERLQNKFSIQNITYDRDKNIRTFTFNAPKEEIEQFLKGEK